jgi:hypothetical protein
MNFFYTTEDFYIDIQTFTVLFDLVSHSSFIIIFCPVFFGICTYLANLLFLSNLHVNLTLSPVKYLSFDF